MIGLCLGDLSGLGSRLIDTDIFTSYRNKLQGYINTWYKESPVQL